MRSSFPFRIRTLALFALVSLALAFAGAGEKKRLTFDQIYKGAEPRLTVPLPVVQGWADDDRYLDTRRKEGERKAGVYAVDAKTGKEELYRDMEQYREIVGTGIEPSSPASANDAYTKLIYVKEKDLYFLDTQTKEFKRLTQTPGEEKNPTLSPDGKRVAFTRDNNLFSIDLASGKEVQYTNDGSEVVLNGWASWLYYEEIFGRVSRYRAFYWSPDGSRLAFYRFDDSPVPVFPIFNSEGQHGFLENTRYPKAGDPNPAVRFGVVPAEGGAVVWADFDEKKDQYFGLPFWTPDGKSVWVQWMNRGQDTLKILAVDPKTGKKSGIYEEVQSSWVEWFESLRFLAGGKGFILRSDKDGWMHLYLHDMRGRLRNRLTAGKWTVVDVAAVNEKSGDVFFTAKKEASTRTDLYKVGLDGKGLTRLTEGDYTNAVRVSPGGKYFITSYSNVKTPTRMALYDGDGGLIRQIADSKGKEFDDYALARTEMFTIPAPGGYNLPVVWTLPVDFDPSKRYPVIIDVYGGPNAGTVADGWKGISNQWLASEGAIQMSVDHRGSGHFGKEGVALMHRQLGKWEMADYGAAAEFHRHDEDLHHGGELRRILDVHGPHGGRGLLHARDRALLGDGLEAVRLPLRGAVHGFAVGESRGVRGGVGPDVRSEVQGGAPDRARNDGR